MEERTNRRRKERMREGGGQKRREVDRVRQMEGERKDMRDESKKEGSDGRTNKQNIAIKGKKEEEGR